MMSTSLVCLDDFERYAAAVLPRVVLDYYRSGAGDEVTLKWNRTAFNKFLLRPRMLRDASCIDLSTTILGHRIEFPVGVAPTAMHCMAHPDGEKATVRAAGAVGTCMVLSTLSTTSLEDVAEAGGPGAHRWFQLYVYKDRVLTEQLVRRAEDAGYSALVLTVDAPVWGKRLADARNNFSMPSHLSLANFSTVRSEHSFQGESDSGLVAYVSALFDSALTWADVDWLRSISRLPLLLKGVLTAEDARLAAQHGVAGIVVSNHGARQLDSAPASIDALAEVVAAVAPWPKMEVFLDGGVRTGVDVLKALLLGARAVFIGRPVVWGLAHSGEAGVTRVLNLLKEEVRVSLALIGAKSIGDLSPEMLALRGAKL